MKRLLNDEDIEVRRKDIEGMRGKPSGIAIPLLLRAMEDNSWRVRKTASEILIEEHPLEQYINSLIGLLYLDENAGARNSAIETLIRLGKRATPFLTDAFDTPNRDVRKFIIDIIGAVKDRKALPLLLKALKDDDENVRASVVEHLGQMGEPTVVDALIEILKSDDLWTAFPAADALGRIGDRRAISALIDALSVKALREPAINALGRLSAPETLEHVVAFLRDTSKTIQQEALKAVEAFYHNGVSSELICESLHRFGGPDIINRLVSHAWSKKADVRCAAILLLGLMQDEGAIGPLLELSADENLVEDVKRAFIFIGKSRPETLIPLLGVDNQNQRRFITDVAASVASPLYYPLFEGMLSDRDGHIRSLAALGLSNIGDRRAIRSLMKLLSDPYVDVQETAVEALSSLGEALNVEDFIDYLKDKNPSLRRNAALILGRIGADTAIPALGFALKDEDVSVRQAVVEALSSIKTNESVRYIISALTDESHDIRASAALSLGFIGGESSMEPLILLLNDSDDTVRAVAARALGMLGDRRAAKHLINMLSDKNGFAVITAIESLGRLGGDEARDALMGMLRSSDDIEIRRTAIRSLSPFEGVEDTILPYLKDPDWATRVAAIEVLSRKATERVKTEIERLYDIEDDPVVRRTIEGLCPFIT
ncbi:MAG: HEAT repeat domain-containing protein [Thermodesulfovibrionales bacterium]